MSMPPRRLSPSRRQRGAVVLYLVMGLVIFGVLAAAGSTYFSSAVRGVLSPNCTAASRMMAESGLRYAAARLRAAATQAELDTARTAMHGQTFVVDAARGYEFTLSIGYDGLGNLQVNATGRGCSLSLPVNTALENSISVNVPRVGAQPPSSGISFAGGDTPGFTPTAIIGGNGAITVDPAGNISLGGGLYESSGSVWYSGTKDVCTSGNCTLGSGLRAYFEFVFNAAAQGDGFVWTIMSANTNTNASSGGDASMGELMGYGGPGALGLGIQPPKFGVEFDIYDNTGTGSACNVGNRADNTDNYDHMAFLYWGTTTLNCSGKTQPATYDDNRHGAGDGTVDQPRNSPNTGGLSGGDLVYYTRSGDPNADNWLKDGGLYKFRYEMLRNTTPNAQGNYCYKLRGWLKKSSDSFPTGLDNTTMDYLGTAPDIYQTLYLSPAMHQKMDKVFFGWTEGTGAATQLVTLSKFKLDFRSGTAPAYSPPADYTAGWPMYEGSGTTVHNTNATNPVDGTVDGSGTAWVTGLGCPACSALDFNGSGFVRVPDNNSLDLTTAGSISAWIRVDQFVNNVGIVHKGQQSNFSDESYSLQFSTNRRLRLYVVSASGGPDVFVQSTQLPNTTGVWRHVAATWDATELKIYIDGVLNNTEANSSGYAAFNSGGNLVIGAQTYSGATANLGFRGAIDEVYLYKRALTASEIAALAVARP